MAIVKRVSDFRWDYEGELHSGWLPLGAANPLPTPVVRVALDLEIESERGGFLLIYRARENSELRNDLWFGTLTEAMAAAEERFGVRPEQWEPS